MFWILLLVMALLGARLLTKPGVGRSVAMLSGCALVAIGLTVEQHIKKVGAEPGELDPEEIEFAEMQAQLRAMFIRPGTISVRDPETLAVRDDVSFYIRQHLTADNCQYFLDGDYSAEDWAVNIALSIDGLLAEVEAQ